MSASRTALARNRAPEERHEAILKSEGVAYERLDGHRGCRTPDCPHALAVAFPWWDGKARYHFNFYVPAVPKRVEVKRGVGYNVYTLEKVLAAARHWKDYVVACDGRFVTLLEHYQLRVRDGTKFRLESFYRQEKPPMTRTVLGDECDLCDGEATSEMDPQEVWLLVPEGTIGGTNARIMEKLLGREKLRVCDKCRNEVSRARANRGR